MNEKRIGLSERWTRIANVMPDGFWPTVRHPNLHVEPSGFRRVVDSSLKTCEEFISTLSFLEEELEKRIPGVRGYHALVQEQGHAPHNYARSNTSGATVVTMGAEVNYAAPTQPESTKENEATSAIIERHGQALLYNKRKLEPEEVISFEKSMLILTKTKALKNGTNEAISALGALNAVLEGGKVFTMVPKLTYFGEQALNDTPITSDLIPLESYWTTLSNCYRMRTTLMYLKPILPKVKE